MIRYTIRETIVLFDREDSSSERQTSIGPDRPSVRQKKGRLLTLGEETHNVKEWSEILGISMNAIIARLKRGLPIERVLSKDRAI